jgi:hypothetical protein
MAFCSAYELYANLRREKDEEIWDILKANFKSTFSREHAKVHFLGVWYV